MRFPIICAAAAVLASLVGGFGAAADDTGFIGIHDLRRYGRYLCTTDHFHAGNGKAQRTKRRAIRSAVADWSSFTSWEYGSDWGKWRYARSKSVKCTGKRPAIQCTVDARMCKRLRRRR